jgi:murein DD-endopeptidase MepM/ murein hydrolase activator NlpD
MITISGTSTMPVKSAPPLSFFIYRDVPTALYGTDINQKTGTTTITATFGDGSRASGSFVIMPRIRPTESLPVPETLGGNSVANQALVLTMLAKENAAIAAVYSRTDKALWTSSFAFPVASTTDSPLTVTDPYGYNRDSGANTITHKGVDFHAPPGTPVYAVNRGVVRVAKSYTVYGNTVIIDHGLGLLSMYMHLSKMSVAPGQLVTKGQRLGLSGETGYAEGPHLHLTIRIGGVSVDPMGFFALFGVK